MVEINLDTYICNKRAVDPDEKIVAISAFFNASLPPIYRAPHYDMRMNRLTDLNAPGLEERRVRRAALQQRVESGDLSFRSLMTQHLLSETFGQGELAIEAQLETLEALGSAVQNGADVRIVLPGADWRRFINSGDCHLVEREGKVGLYVQATPRGDLVLADEANDSYSNARNAFNYLWEDDPLVLRTQDAVLGEISAATQQVQAIPTSIGQ